MNKFLIFSLVFSLSALYGMEQKEKKIACDTEGNEIDWPKYKKLYFEWYQEGTPLGTEERWECLKNGVDAGVVEVASLMDQNAPPPPPYPKYYLAYATKKIVDQNNETERFLYQSPGSWNGDLLKAKVDKLYCIDEEKNSALLLIGWKTNEGVDNAGWLPLGCQPPEQYFPDWKNNKKLWVYWIDLKQIKNYLTQEAAEQRFQNNNNN